MKREKLKYGKFFSSNFKVNLPWMIRDVEESGLKKKSIFLVFALIITTIVLFAGCAATQPTQVTSNPALMSTATSAGEPMTQSATRNIVETAEADGRFTSLVTAVKAADLNDTLSDPDSTFTLFAPTDDAFKNLPDGTMDALLKDPQGDLLQILLYHVVNEKLMAVDLGKLTSAETLQGGSLPISVSNGTLRVDGATVIITDIKCSNGVIHGVDTVMLPPA
jgi:transforming growth factor-beta-induced protein